MQCLRAFLAFFPEFLRRGFCSLLGLGFWVLLTGGNGKLSPWKLCMGCADDIHCSVSLHFDSASCFACECRLAPVGDPPSPRAAHAATAVGTMVVIQVHLLLSQV